MANNELTATEREFLENLDKVNDNERGGNFGLLKAKKYTGTNSRILALNGTAADIGSVRMSRTEEGVYYLDGIDGETYRIPEPKDGIDSIFELEFKRK